VAERNGLKTKADEEIERLEKEALDVKKKLEANIKELTDEAQQLRNTLAMSSGDHQSWSINTLSAELTQIKNKVRAGLLRNSDGIALKYLSLCSAVVFDSARLKMSHRLEQIAIQLGFPSDSPAVKGADGGSQDNRGSLAYRTRLFVKSVLQVNYDHLRKELALEGEVVKEVAQILSQKIRLEINVIGRHLAVVGLDEAALTNLATFALKLQLLEPPVRYRFDSIEGVSEKAMLSKILAATDPPIDDKKVYLFPAIDQWSNQESVWVPTEVELTYVD